MSITLIATGGTIASTLGADGRVTTTLGGDDLVASVAGSLPVLTHGVEVVDLSVPGSWNLTTALAASVARVARAALDNGTDGVVITHGTDVIEETAWLCELLARDATEAGGLVLTCSMRHASELGYDGPRNITDSMSVAAAPEARGRGAMVCANGELHHARWVRKTHTTALSTFASPDRGPIGTVGEQGVVFAFDPPAAPPDVPASVGVVGEVPIVTSHWDDDPDLIGWHLSRGAKGIVIDGGGAGNVNGLLVDGVMSAIDAGVPVVGTSRCLRGEVAPIYGGNGGFASLTALGVIPSHGLSAGKARVTLGVALGIDPDPGAVRSYFDSVGGDR